MSLRAPALATLAACVAVLAACHGNQDAAQAETAAAGRAPDTVTIVATEYAFDAPASIPAGEVTLKLEDQGKLPHHVQLLRLDEGKTPADFQAAMQAMKGPGPFPSWVHEAGGVNPPPIGGSATATVDLQPGQYMMVCLIPIPGGVPHIARGMARPLTVTPSSGAAAVAPVADDTIRMTDYAYDIAHPLTAGDHQILVENVGPQPHELVLARLAPGKTLDDALAWAKTLEGPPPGEMIGGAAAMSNGQHETIGVNLTPGDYVLLCFVPDAKDGQPHVMKGMAKQFHVGA